MNPEVIALSIPVIAIVAIATVFIYIRKYSNQERMAMIERGIDIHQNQPKKRQGYETLKFGLFFIGIGLGFLFGHMADMNTTMRELSYFVMLFIFGGLGLLVSHFIVQRQMRKDEKEGR